MPNANTSEEANDPPQQEEIDSVLKGVVLRQALCAQLGK